MVSDASQLLQDKGWGINKFGVVTTDAEPSWIEEIDDEVNDVFQVTSICSGQFVLVNVQSQKCVGLFEILVNRQENVFGDQIKRVLFLTQTQPTKRYPLFLPS